MAKPTDQGNAAYVSPAEASRLAFVSTKTLARMADSGDIRSIRLPSGHRRYHRGDVTPDIDSTPADSASPHAESAGVSSLVA
ncbi:MAG: hypothetical protein JWP85_2081 [Rhodoglobus sp.]|nr:hypothetical protein [Rhodoglobus sp.]